MSYNIGQQTIKIVRVRTLFAAALVLACAFGTVNHAAAQVTPPPVPDTIAVPAGNSPYLVGHARGSQGYTCLPTSDGGTAWNPNGARPEATLFTDFFSSQFQIITHFQSINENPKTDGFVPPLSGNATWQSSLDSSRVWAVKAKGIDAGSDPASCPIAARFNASCCSRWGTRRGSRAVTSCSRPPSSNV